MKDPTPEQFAILAKERLSDEIAGKGESSLREILERYPNVVSNIGMVSIIESNALSVDEELKKQIVGIIINNMADILRVLEIANEESPEKEEPEQTTEN